MLFLAGLLLMSKHLLPVITPFAHGKRAAFSLEFDDSMDSQVKNALPLLAQYRIPATFYINPGRTNYPAARKIWEEQVPAAGHELGDHTMHHGDTVGAEKGAEEIGGAAKAIENALGHPVLTPLGIPGGVKWEIPEEDFQRILKENRLFFPGRKDFYQDGQGDILRFPKLALENETWGQLGFHGIGGEWLSTSVSALQDLLQYLDAHRDEIWIAPTGTVWKYQREREALVNLQMHKKEDGEFDLFLELDHEKLQPFTLYNVPLTVQVPVPAEWTKAWVTTQGRQRQFRVHEGVLEIDLPPSASVSHIRKG